MIVSNGKKSLLYFSIFIVSACFIIFLILNCKEEKTESSDKLRIKLIDRISILLMVFSLYSLLSTLHCPQLKLIRQIKN